MGYLHIDNLYKNRDVLMFRECYALEKIHGTSAHIGCDKDGVVKFFAGGAKHDHFVGLFTPEQVARVATRPGTTIYGEAYGGSMQGMRETYGPTLHFIAFDVKVGDRWLQVEQAAAMVESFGLEFVPWWKSSTDLAALDALRDQPSVVAQRRGIVEPKTGEGIVIRPLQEFVKNGERVIAKHKTAAFQERRKQPASFDPAKQAVEADAERIALEWVVPMRLNHILGRGLALATENIPNLIAAMIEDVEREAAGEIVCGAEAKRAIGRATAKLVKSALNASIKGDA